MSDEILQQNLGEKAEFNNIFFIHLLFDKDPSRVSADELKSVLEKKVGETDIVVSGKDHGMTSFAIKKYSAEFKDGCLPAQVMIYEKNSFEQEDISAFERTQLWDVRDSEQLLEKCEYKIMISDFLSATVEYKERAEMLMHWLNTTLEVYQDCVAVWIPSSGKLLTADQIKSCDVPFEDMFIYTCLNVRFFNIQDTEDKLIDTLGLYAIGLPDIQMHFHGLNPNDVVNYMYNIASYVYENNAPVENGETISGLTDGKLDADVKWKCQYEDSLIQPKRVVMDICANEYSSGNRHDTNSH